MNNKIRWSLLATVVVGVSVAVWHLSQPGTGSTAEVSTEIPESPPSAAAEPDSQQLKKLLVDPRVESYFQREEDKQSLSDYFHGEPGELTDEEAWELIEDVEREGRVMAYEALSMKLAWLERNSANKAEFDSAAAELVEEYRQRAKRSAEEYNPYRDVPGFAEYKEAEKRIVRQVQEMDSFPDGMSRQEYLRKRLLEARAKAYGP